MGRWTLWRRGRAAEGTEDAVRCPDCGVRTAGLKPKRVRIGTGASPKDLSGLLESGQSGQPGKPYQEALSDSVAHRESGKYVLFYRCPACKSFFSATQAGSPG
jgi:uncharacterized protein with PIN domain